MTELEAAAAHEAGHLVAADALNLPVLYAEISPDGSGYTHYDVPEDLDYLTPAAGDLAHVRLIAALAGTVAEATLIGPGPDEADDARHIWRAALLSIGAEPDGPESRLASVRILAAEEIAGAEAVARRIVSERLEAVQSVAAELVEHRRLPGDRLKEVVRAQ